MLRGLFLASVLLLTPLAAHAKSVTEWNFLDGQVPGTWDVSKNLTTTPTPEGLHIRTTGEGFMRRDTGFTHSVDVIRIWYRAPKSIEGHFRWHVRGTEEGVMVKLPFTFRESLETRSQNLNASFYPQWDPGTDRVAFSIDEADAEVLIERIEFIGWNPFEKFASALLSFWKTERLRAHSINFLWGPQITWNPIAREQVFYSEVPQGMSANVVFYAFLSIALMALIIVIIRSRKTGGSMRRWILGFFLLFGAMWFLYDVRMGTEMIGYLRDDYNLYLSEAAPLEARYRRNHFDRFASAARPHVTSRDRFLFMSKHRWPYLGLIRYYMYPSLPILPDQNSLEGIDTLVVYDRPEIIFNEYRQLSRDGEAFSPPGKKIFEMEEGSFVFRATAP